MADRSVRATALENETTPAATARSLEPKVDTTAASARGRSTSAGVVSAPPSSPASSADHGDHAALRDECEVALSIPHDKRAIAHGDAFYEAVLRLVAEAEQADAFDPESFALGPLPRRNVRRYVLQPEHNPSKGSGS